MHTTQWFPWNWSLPRPWFSVDISGLVWPHCSNSYTNAELCNEIAEWMSHLWKWCSSGHRLYALSPRLKAEPLFLRKHQSFSRFAALLANLPEISIHSWRIYPIPLLWLQLCRNISCGYFVIMENKLAYWFCCGANNEGLSSVFPSVYMGAMGVSLRILYATVE
jgi:hypothetical protein